MTRDEAKHAIVNLIEAVHGCKSQELIVKLARSEWFEALEYNLNELVRELTVEGQLVSIHCTLADVAATEVTFVLPKDTIVNHEAHSSH